MCAIETRNVLLFSGYNQIHSLHLFPFNDKNCDNEINTE